MIYRQARQTGFIRDCRTRRNARRQHLRSVPNEVILRRNKRKQLLKIKEAAEKKEKAVVGILVAAEAPPHHAEVGAAMRSHCTPLDHTSEKNTTH